MGRHEVKFPECRSGGRFEPFCGVFEWVLGVKRVKNGAVPFLWLCCSVGRGRNNAVILPHFPSEIFDYGEITLFYLTSCHKMWTVVK